ncbi:TrkA C-terminal domain-containing protein [Natronomonas sp. EA1]|uniref:TrkA C-terminal domain-containing protein n=1 Tax=Natronomonas sp. EA1 TaxID=3421655 RepID=UPI003EBD4ADD
MAPLPVEILQGIYIGILTGIIPALVAWGLGFAFKYFTGVTIPGFGVVVLALAVAGVNGGLLALNDPTIRESATAPVVVTAIIVVLMLSLYAHSKGDTMGANFPKRLSLKGLRDRTLSTDVVELIGGRNQVRITVTGEVIDMEGYPPVPDDIRAGIRDGKWTLPADIPLSELETRFAERLRTEFDLADVSVNIDAQGNATVVVAPPLSGLSKRVPQGHRAVSIDCLVPTGLARGDRVTVLVGDQAVSGTVVSAKSSGTEKPKTDGGEEAASETPAPARQTTTGGDGRLTVAVPRADAGTLMGATSPHVVVTARGTRTEYELISLLRRAGKRFRKLTVGEGELDGVTLGEADIRDRYEVGVLAVRRPNGWVLAPRGDTVIQAGDEVFAVGQTPKLDAFAEVVA